MVSQGDHAVHALKSLISGKILSGGALIAALREHEMVGLHRGEDQHDDDGDDEHGADHGKIFSMGFVSALSSQIGSIEK